MSSEITSQESIHEWCNDAAAKEFNFHSDDGENRNALVECNTTAFIDMVSMESLFLYFIDINEQERAQ